MSKRSLQILVRRTRGGHAMNLVRERISEMSDEEARQWLVLFQNVQTQAQQEGESNVRRRYPWHR